MACQGVRSLPVPIWEGSYNLSTHCFTHPVLYRKSSVVRTVALIAIMAQIGSYVPATSVKMSLLDAVLTRMGGGWSPIPVHLLSSDFSLTASDDLTKGRSTFMMEMTETRDILCTATNKSLVILDELGRGTSTFDGVRWICHWRAEDLSSCRWLLQTQYSTSSCSQLSAWHCSSPTIH